MEKVKTKCHHKGQKHLNQKVIVEFEALQTHVELLLQQETESPLILTLHSNLASLLMLVSMETCLKATLLAAVHLLFTCCQVILTSADTSKLCPLPLFYLSKPSGQLSQTAQRLITIRISQQAQKNSKTSMDVHIV